MSKKYDATKYIVMYLLGYAFFIIFVYTQILHSYYKLSVVIVFSIALLMMPLILYYVIHKLKYPLKVNSKIHFIYTLISLVYFLATNIMILNMISTMFQKYYYPSFPIYLICFLLLIPTVYISFKNSKFYYSLSYIFLIVYIIYQFIYIFSGTTFETYPLTNILDVNPIYQIILLSTTIIFEPLILLSNISNISLKKTLNLKLIMSIGIFISLIGIYYLFRTTMEFGLVMDYLNFPYLESYRLSSSYITNLDYLYLFMITMLLFARIPYLVMTIKDEYEIKSKITLTIPLLLIITTYYLDRRLEFYQNIIIPTLFILSILLMILFIMSFFFKRRTTNENK